MNKESCEYAWQKIKDITNDIVSFLKEKGKDVVNVIYDIVDENEKRIRRSIDKEKSNK